MRMRLIWLAVVLTAGCDASPFGSATVVEREGEPYVVVYPPGDFAMDAAIADARASVDSLIAELPRLQDQGVYVSVKAPLVAGRDTEHIWLDAPEYRDGVFHGNLGNAPIYSSLRLGDRYSVASDEISDWMAILDGELYGGYTIFVARDGLDSTQREEFMSSLDFRMPDRPRGF